MRIRPVSIASSHTVADSLPSTDDVLVSLSSDPETKSVLITVTPPLSPAGEKGAGRRTPLDICCVIDVSASMISEASIPADPATGRPAESNGLSVLDVVKHSLRTIVTTMQEDDRISLVTFSDEAKVVFNLTKMNKAGKTGIGSIIENLRTEGMTNLWDGLKLGMTLFCDDAAASSKKPGNAASGRFSTLFILTDGMPNITPPRGHNAMLRAFLDAHPLASFSISTFGFGYGLDSQLLLDLAQIGGGGFGFIPDSGMVGTLFIHAAANAYATYASRSHLDIELPPGTEADVKGAYPVVKTSWGIQIDIGDLQYGQSRDFVVVIPKSHANISAMLTYRPFNVKEDIKVLAVDSATPDLASIKYHTARLDFVDALFATPNLQALKALKDRIESAPILAKHDDAKALAKDISGEGLLALEADNFSRWGRHYLLFLARAHQRQQSGNFKDPGLQVYGRNSAVFVAERDKLDAAFDALPPPKPSRPVYASHGGRGPLVMGKRGSVGPVRTGSVYMKTMSAYNSAAGPCFAGDCLVKVPRGTEIRVDQLKRGMVIESMVGPRTVAAVVHTATPSGEALLCRIGDLKVTPWHPISMQDKWVFPADIASPQTMACPAIYSVLLQPTTTMENANAHTISIAGVWGVTLGHGIITISTQDVRAHPFLGNYEKVLGDISTLHGFYADDGIVHCTGTRRRGVDQHICGFIGEREMMNNQEIGDLRKMVECTV